LFGHDYARRMMRKSKHKRLMIVEGPRDVMRPLSFGIPTVGNMGGTTVWTKDKADLITFLNPNELIVATDPDEIGNKLSLLIREALPDIKMRRLYLNPNGKEDPGSMSDLRLTKLSKYFE
jgi:5S rRNA maturation endonuclease (ribonuclease M5)